MIHGQTGILILAGSETEMQSKSQMANLPIAK